MAALQAPPSLGFSRQEHWSGLPFPSPTHESEKWKWSHSVVSDSWRPHGPQPTRLLHPWEFSRQEYWSGVPLPSLHWGHTIFSPHGALQKRGHTLSKILGKEQHINSNPLTKLGLKTKTFKVNIHEFQYQVSTRATNEFPLLGLQCLEIHRDEQF